MHNVDQQDETIERKQGYFITREGILGCRCSSSRYWGSRLVETHCPPKYRNRVVTNRRG